VGSFAITAQQNKEGDIISYYIVKPDKRITNAIHINMTKEQLEQANEEVITCDLGEKYLQMDYIMVRKLFSTFHLFSDGLKELLEIYDETLEFYPIFLCDNQHMQSVVYWKCVCTALDCIAEGNYKSIDDVVFQSDKIGERFLFRVDFEKQEYFVFDRVLTENILRKEYLGISFQKVKHMI
jgi:hypothetical protein